MPTREEYEAMPDLRAELPKDETVNLDPDDKVILIEDHSEDMRSPEVMPDPVDMLCQLGRVEKPEDLGKNFITASGLLPGRDKGKGQAHFAVPFPRDYCYMMLALKEKFPFLPARGILQINRYLAMNDNVYRAAQYGRDAHEVRDPATDEIARRLSATHHWQWPYHGQIDVAALVIRLAHWVCFETEEGFSFLSQTYIGEDGDTHTMLDSLIFREEWLRRRLLSNRDGILEFLAEFDGSHKVQTMEDSWCSHLHADGTEANLTNGCSSTEALVDCWEALVCLAEIYDYANSVGWLFLSDLSCELRRLATRLHNEIWKLWIPEKKFFAMGFDRDAHGKLRRLESPKAIPAFVLDTRFFSKTSRDQMVVKEYVRRIFEPDLFSAVGFRTLSTEHPRFNPGRYHLGSIWPFMSFRIAEGLRRQGMPHLAHKIYEIIVDTFEHFRMWPELIRGELDGSFKVSRYRIKAWNRRTGFEDTISSVPQAVQGWSVSAHIASRERLNESLPPITPFEQEILASLPF